MHLTASQQKGLEILSQTDKNVFLTGGAGTGKSTLLNHWIETEAAKDDWFKSETGIMASTGAAAILVGGCTFHSFFGLGIDKGDRDTIIFRAAKNKPVIDRLKRVKRIVIDEISMLRGQTLEYADQIARIARGDNSHFGGLRVIVVGDFFQIPPICDDKKSPLDWVFRSTTWEDADFSMINLTEIMRTTDIDFMNILAKMRVGVKDESVSKFLHSRLAGSPAKLLTIDGTRLYGTREQVDRHNKYMLSLLPGDYQVYRSEYSGSADYYQRLQNSAPVPDKLVLKKDALVMVRKNNAVPGCVNGTLGHIREFGKDEDKQEYLTFQTLKGMTYTVYKTKFDWVDADGSVRASVVNFPFSVAYACTIHKAQGASIDRVICDIDRVWEPGQAYVAVSRAKFAAELYIEKWKAEAIFASDEVIDFYQLIEAMA